MVPRSILYKWSDTDEELTHLDDFVFSENTEAYGSCGVVFENRMLVFGGYSEQSQRRRFF